MIGEMQVVIFSWEYPPRVVGRLSDDVKALSTQLADRKVGVNIVTYDKIPGQRLDEKGVKTFSVTNPVREHIGILTWVLTLNEEVERVTAKAYYETSKQIDVIDAFDWHFIPAAVSLRAGLGIPFVYSVESLEDHRSNFADNPNNMAIKSIEWHGFYEASVVAVKSQWMRDEINRIYKVPREKIEVALSAEDKLTIYSSLEGGSSAT